jgi:hypothetical protein
MEIHAPLVQKTALVVNQLIAVCSVSTTSTYLIKVANSCMKFWNTQNQTQNALFRIAKNARALRAIDAKMASYGSFSKMTVFQFQSLESSDFRIWPLRVKNIQVIANIKALVVLKDREESQTYA